MPCHAMTMTMANGTNGNGMAVLHVYVRYTVRASKGHAST
jgi:hypothetical protein